jgi:hypothetical protein
MIDHLPDDVERSWSRNNALTWYLLLSLPGTAILIILVILYGLGGLAFEAIWTIFSPVIWVFPIVFVRQTFNVISGKFVPIGGNTFAYVAILLGLYLWAGLAAKLLMNIEG